MRKIFCFFLVFGMFLLLVLITIKYFHFGTYNYNNADMGINIDIPKLSKLDYVNDKSISFITFRDKKVISSELNNVLEKYQKYYCHNNDYYYNSTSDITITDYSVEGNAIYNRVTINYIHNKIDNNDCNVILDYHNLEYLLMDRNSSKEDEESCWTKRNFKYKNVIDGKIYNVYYNCVGINGDITFKSGANTYHQLDIMLMNGWTSMNDIIDYFEYRYLNGEINKEFNYKAGYNIYITNKFSVVVCNTKDGNKDIYFDSNSLKNNKKYCSS